MQGDPGVTSGVRRDSECARGGHPAIEQPPGMVFERRLFSRGNRLRARTDGRARWRGFHGRFRAANKAKHKRKGRRGRGKRFVGGGGHKFIRWKQNGRMDTVKGDGVCVPACSTMPHLTHSGTFNKFMGWMDKRIVPSWPIVTF